MGPFVGFYIGGATVLAMCFIAGCMEGNIKRSWRILLQAYIIVFMWPIALPIWLGLFSALKEKR